MNNDQQQQPPMNGNDDLAKTLNEGLQFEETPMPGMPPTPPPPMPGSPATQDLAPPTPAADDEDMKMPSLDPAAGDPDNEPYTPPTMSITPPAAEPQPAEKKPEPQVEHTHAKNKGKQNGGMSDLDSLKASALEELRPLVRKLKLPPEERFDTFLLVIRSTDDQTLLEQAHEAAKEITDDTRRAQALLDIIKEIDYFSSKR